MFVLYLIGAYLIGSIPFGLIIAFIAYDIDIRNHGSKNIGMSNVLRTVGLKPALLTLTGDVGKGWLMMALSPFTEVWELTLIAMAVLFGHCYSVFLQGKGGKAVATSMGVLLAQIPGTAMILASIWLVVRLFTKKASLASLSALSLLIPLTVYNDSELIWLSLFITGLIVFRHKENIERLRTHSEFD